MFQEILINIEKLGNEKFHAGLTYQQLKYKIDEARLAALFQELKLIETLLTIILSILELLHWEPNISGKQNYVLKVQWDFYYLKDKSYLCHRKTWTQFRHISISKSNRLAKYKDSFC